MKYRKAYDDVLTEPVDTGDKVYEWDYLNEKGDVVTDKRNMYEYIQSFKRITDYKEVIDDNGNIDPIFSGPTSGVYADVSAVPDDYVGLNNYLANLAKIIKQDIAAEQAKKATVIEQKSPKATEQATQVTAQAEGGNK